jgi:hypothetical protein
MDRSLQPAALRLVGDNPADAAARSEDVHRLAVEDENRAASTLPAGDATRLFAMQVSESLEGGQSAILTPAKRHRLLRLGQRLGVRDFDANLVIAIVQDGARRGENIHNNLTRDRLRLVSVTGAKREHASMVRMIVVAGAIAIGAVIGLVAWITSA